MGAARHAARGTLLALALASAPECASGWSIYAGGASAEVDYENITTALASTYRWSYRRPLIRWALTPDFCSTLQPLLVENLVLNWPFPADQRQNFTTCARIHSIIAGSFAVWAAANPNLHFVDMTGRCEAERLWRPVDDDRCSESNFCLDLENATAPAPYFINWQEKTTPLENMPSAEPWMCSHRTCWQCDRADVLVGGFTQKNRQLGDQHSKTRVQRTSLSEQPPLSPTMRPAAGKTVSAAWLEFNVDPVFKNSDAEGNGLGNATVDNCWRLDNGLCDIFIAIPGFESGTALNEAILIGFWCFFSVLLCLCLCILLSLLQRLAANLLTGWDVDRDGKLELQEIVYVLDEFCGEVCFECRCPFVHQKKMTVLAGVLSVLETLSDMPIMLPTITMLLLCAMGLVYFDGVANCFTCRDFRASAIHAIGHLLSLHHPDAVDGTVPLVSIPDVPPPNISAGELAACESPLWGVDLDPAALSLHPNKSIEGRAGGGVELNSSVMLAFGTTGLERPIAGAARRCLAVDDIEGLNFLYGSCVTELGVPDCPVREEVIYVGMRLSEQVTKLMIVPFLVLLGLKLLSIVALVVEDWYASYQVRREAQRLLEEAEAAELRRQAKDRGEEVAEPAQAAPSPTKRLFGGMKRTQVVPNQAQA